MVTGQRRLGLVAAGATLLAAAPLSTIFASWTWLLQCVIAVGLVAGAGLLTRTMRAPLWVQALGMVGSLLLVLTWMFPSGEELLALLPTPATFTWFGQLLTEAGADTRAYGVPVPDRDGLLFVAVVGVGSVAILVDLLTVGLRKPALAGLPMLAIYSVPVAVYVDSVPVTPFIVGAVGFLWLLVADNVDRVRRFGRRFTGDGRDVDVWEPSPLAAAGRRLAVLGVVAAVLVPLAVPGLSGGLLSQLTQANGGVGGPGNGGGNGRVNLFAKLNGDLHQSGITELLRVTTEEPDPFYLRFGVADVVTDDGFASRPSIAGRPVTAGPLADGRIDGSPQGVTSQQFHASVQVTGNFDIPYVPVYSTVIATQKLDGNWNYDPQMQVVYSGRSTTRNKKYEFDYIRTKFSPAALRTAPTLAADNPLRTQFTSVPKNDLVSNIVSGVVRGQRTDYDKVLAIYRYFSKENGFSYQLQTKSGTTGSDIADFLTTKVGFCQQYAAAMAWMVRTAGIPSRVAFGFTRGNTRKGQAYVLTNRNLHAWTEVFLEGYGWVPFDATPASDVTGSARSDWAPDTDQPQPSVSASAEAAVPGTAASTAAGGPTNSAPNFNDRDAGPDNAAAVAGTSNSGALLAVAAGALLLALLAVPAIRRALVRRRRHAATIAQIADETVTGDDSDPLGVVVTTEAVRARADAHAAWDELVDTMVDFQVPVDPTETPRHTAERLVREIALVGEPAEAATLLGRAEERARYARQPLQGGELAVALGHVRRALAGAADRRTRVVALLFPPSVMASWRASLSDVSGRLIGAASRRRTAASRWNPRRLLAHRSAR